MKKILYLLLFLIFGISVYSQQVLRGYNVNFLYSFVSYGDSLALKYCDKTIFPRSTQSSQMNANFGLLFDFGYSRHRFVLAPGVDFTQINYNLNATGYDLINEIGNSLGTKQDKLSLSSFIIAPQVALSYKYHFYLGRVHLSLSLGADVKFIITNTISLKINNKDLIVYQEENDMNSSLSFFPNSIYSKLSELKTEVTPRLGLDIYLSKYLGVSLLYQYPHLANIATSPKLKAGFGLGLIYLVPFTKEDNSNILQYYKTI